MSNDWPAVCLNDFVSIKHGFAFKGEFFSDTPTKDVLVTPGNFAVGGGFKSDKLKYYNGPVPEDYILNPDDLLVTMTDLSKQADTLGFSALVPSHSSNQYLHNQRIGLVTFKNLELDKFYLFFLLRSQEYRHHVISSATGSTVKHTSPSRITSFELRLPPLPVQEKVGRVLKYFEDKIQLNNQISQTLEQMAQAIFKSWFVDFEPTKAKIAVLDAGGTEDEALLAAMTAISGKNNAELEQFKNVSPEQYKVLKTTAELFPSEMQDSELGEIPEGWEASTIGVEFDVTMGQSPPGSSYNESGDGSAFFQGRRDFGVRFPANRVYCTEPKRMAKQGDTLLSVRAPVGDVNIASIDCCIGRGLAAIRHKTGCSSFTYYSVINLGQSLASYNSEGTVFGSINQKSLNSLPMIAPTKKTLEVFSNIVGKLDDMIKALSIEVLTLAELRDTLLPKLLSGELDISGLADNLESDV